jgi:hypothetical protein
MHWTYPRCLLVFILLSSVIAFAQMRTAISVRTAPVDLGGITQRAGTIFAGRVLKIEPVRVASSNDLASVQITCAVEHGVRGTRDGEVLSFREWAGLWAAGPRYPDRPASDAVSLRTECARPDQSGRRTPWAVCGRSRRPRRALCWAATIHSRVAEAGRDRYSPPDPSSPIHACRTAHAGGLKPWRT